MRRPSVPPSALTRWLVLLVSVAGCGTSAATVAARRGDWAALAAAVAAQEKAGDLSNRGAAAIARQVAEREIRAATGPQAVECVHDVRSCARVLDDVLAERMRTHDAAGAEAALARIEGGELDLGEARAHVADPDPPWRAVGARGLVRKEDGPARLRALLDPAPEVRREAARAARDAHGSTDLPALIEVARVDPEPLVRTEAVRAIAGRGPLWSMAPSTASSRAKVDALRDLWTVADEGLREDIVLAWAAPSIWEAGGEEAIGVLVASAHGPAVVEAAAAVLRHPGAPVPVAQAAVAQLVRSIEEGPRALALQAIAQAQLDRPDLVDAVRRAAGRDDLDVRVAALARLGEVTADPAARGAIASQLEALAQPGSPFAGHARFALAEGGDRRVQAWAEHDLSSGASDVRLAAATDLAALGLEGRAAPLLADRDPRVRLRAACIILNAARTRSQDPARTAFALPSRR